MAVARACSREAYTQRRFRKRVEIVMIDRDVQMAYWRKHVSKRRQAEAKALQAGIDRGLLLYGEGHLGIIQVGLCRCRSGLRMLELGLVAGRGSGEVE